MDVVILPVSPVTTDAYVSHCFDHLPDDTSPLGGLLWAELRIITDQADLSLTDREILALYSRGLSPEDIGKVFGMGPQEVEKRQRRIFRRLRRTKHLGLLTVLVEAFGWDAFAVMLD